MLPTFCPNVSKECDIWMLLLELLKESQNRVDLIDEEGATREQKQSKDEE